MRDYAGVFRDEAVATRYDEVVYAPGTWASEVHRRQRAYLRRWLCRAYPRIAPVHHDFACGTGRVLEMFADLVAARHGYDTSATMLARARSRGLDADLHLVPEGEDARPAAAGPPALVTVFRFLLNAPPAAREAAIAFAARVLPDRDAGYLVVENHGPKRSLRGLGRHRHRDDPWFAELSHEEVTDLLGRHGFTVVRRRGFGMAPPGAYRRDWARPYARALDAASTALPHATVATNVVHIARRT